MDFSDESIESEAKPIADEKSKKKVVINDKDQVRTINPENGNSKGKFRQNLEETHWPWRISVIIFLIGFLFQVLSYGSPYWLAVGKNQMHIGIWSDCFKISNCTFRIETSDCLNSVRVFGGTGVLCGLVTCILLLVHVKHDNNRRCLALSTVTLCFVSALCNQISTAVFGRTVGCSFTNRPSMSEYRWAWCLALAFMSVLLTVVSGLIFLIIELRDISRKQKTRRPWNGRGMVIT